VSKRFVGGGALAQVYLPETSTDIASVGVDLLLNLTPTQANALAQSRSANSVGRVFMLSRIGNEWVGSGANDEFPIYIFQGIIETIQHIIIGENDENIPPKSTTVTIRSRFFANGTTRHIQPRITFESIKRTDPTDLAGRQLAVQEHNFAPTLWGARRQPPRKRKRGFFSAFISAGIAAGVTFFTGGTGAVALKTGIVAFAASAIQSFTAPRPPQVPTQSVEVAGVRTESDPPRQFVFGKALISSAVLHQAVHAREYLQRVLVVANHPCEALEKIVIGEHTIDVAQNGDLTGTQYARNMKIATRLNGIAVLDVGTPFQIDSRTGAVLGENREFITTESAFSGVINGGPEAQRRVAWALVGVKVGYDQKEWIP